MKSKQQTGNHPIAVIGMALRVPGASTPERFWQNLLVGRDTLTRTTRDQLRFKGVPEDVVSNPLLVCAKPTLTDIDYFDNDYFEMSPYECERIDPVHRLFLECVVEGLERAAIRTGPDGPVTGIFSGVEGDYRRTNLKHLNYASDPSLATQVRLGSETEFAAARASYKLNLTGPSFAVEAACATSLLAIHLAADSLRSGACEVAIAGGGAVLLPNFPAYLGGLEGMLSSGGRIHAFDARADGTIFGSGAGVVVLRPLETAIAAGNQIHAVLVGSATSNDGNPPGKESFIAPSSSGQKLAIKGALDDAGINADTIGYMEAHGTATLLGDPTEVSSLTDVFQVDTDRKNFCAIGSVKSNVGHLRNAAGVVSFIKACLAVSKKTLPPAANFEHPNPMIDFQNSPFYINTETLPWDQGSHPRRAGISAFGFGGSNVHAIVEEYTAPAEPKTTKALPTIIPLSGLSPEILNHQLENIHAYIQSNPDQSLENIAHSLRQRKRLSHSACLIYDPRVNGDLANQFEKVVGQSDRGTYPTVFLFPGQGAQYAGMGGQLYESEAVFRESVDQCAELLLPELEYDVRTLLCDQHSKKHKSRREQIHQTVNAQPALFTLEISLAKLFCSWGLEPDYLLGHSIGELVAGCVAEVMSIEDGARLVAARARLMQQCDLGSMIAIFLPINEVEARLPETLDIAAINAPNLTVVSGPSEAITTFEGDISAQGIGCRLLDTSHAFHSRMMEPALEEFSKVAATLVYNNPKIPIISNVTGTPITPRQAKDPAYWVGLVRHRVNFSQGMAWLLSHHKQIFLELGPGSTLSDMTRFHDRNASVTPSMVGGSVEEKFSEQHRIYRALSQVWCYGVNIDWGLFEQGRIQRKITLPTYPFQRQRFWINHPDAGPQRALHLYRRGWKLEETSDSADQPVISDKRPWIVLMDGCGLGAAIVQYLEKLKQLVITVTTSKKFSQIDNRNYTIRPANRDDARSLFESVGSANPELAPRILHLWTISGSAGAHNDATSFQHSCEMGFYSLLAFAQGAHDYSMAGSLDILAVTDGMLALDDEAGPAYAEKSSIIGPCRLISTEIPGAWVRGLDVPDFEPEQIPQWLVEGIVDQATRLQSESDSESLAILRPQGVFREQLMEQPEMAISRANLRNGGTVLITGGLGGLGPLFAKAIYQWCHARLIVTTRQKMPPKKDWQAISQENNRLARGIKQLVELESLGAEILVLEVDIANLKALTTGLNKAVKKFGTINGVLHAAGTTDDGPVLGKSREAANEVFSGKVMGAFNLEKIFDQQPLDFFIHFSSVSSVHPKTGQVDYSSANAVLDALASRRRSTCSGLNSAIGWGSWLEIGLAARTAGVEFGSQNEKEVAALSTDSSKATPVNHPLLSSCQILENGNGVYQGQLDPDQHWTIAEHRIDDRCLMSGTTIIECLYIAYSAFCGQKQVVLSNLVIVKAFYIGLPETRFRVVIEKLEDDIQLRFESYDTQAKEWGIHASCTASLLVEDEPEFIDVESHSNLAKQWDHSIWTVKSKDWFFGDHWKCVNSSKENKGATWTHLSLPKKISGDVTKFGLHPALFDQGLTQSANRFFRHSVPYAFESIKVYRPLERSCVVIGDSSLTGNTRTFDIQYADPDGQVAIDIRGYIKREIDSSKSVIEADNAGISSTINDKSGPFCISTSRPGDLEALEVNALDLPAPGADEIQIKVAGAGLNFRDVLAAMGQFGNIEPGEIQLGVECSGVITALGEKVNNFNIGDPVLALARPALASHVNVEARLVRNIPINMSFELAAGIPTVFLTAHYALNELAKIQEGERILIHAATGGVGLAAIQIARLKGAEIFATAGRPEKREYLEGLGIEHIMDSRSTDFANEIMEITAGEGVDIVLNSLVGNSIDAGLDILKPLGRFVEIGKRDIYANTPLGLSPFRKNISYFSVDLAIVQKQHHDLFTELFDWVMQRLNNGSLEAVPTTVVPVDRVSAGFQRMSRADHIGKIVFKMCELKVTPDSPAYNASTLFQFEEKFGKGITPDFGKEAFRQIFSSIDVPGNFLASSFKFDEIAYRIQKSSGILGKSRPEIATPYRAPVTEDEEKLANSWGKFLGISPIGLDDNFFELGGDSLSIMQIQTVVNSEFKVNIPMDMLLDRPTISGLVDAINLARN